MLFVLAMLFSCENDIKKVEMLDRSDTMPVEIAENIKVYYSDSGMLRAYLQSPLMLKFEEEEEPYIEFPKGVKVIFYDSLEREQTQITARYGINYEDKRLMEARNKVVVINYEKDEKLETERLVWNQRKRIIFSDVFVKITTRDKVIYGDGLESDESFTKYTIKNPSGVIEADEDE